MATAARVSDLASRITTGNLARVALGQSLTDLATAYTKVKSYNPTVLGISIPDSLVGLDPFAIPAYEAAGGSGSATDVSNQTTEYLDGIRTRAESDFAALPATDDSLDPSVANQIAFDIASIETACGVTNSTLNQTALQDYADSVTDAVRDIVPNVAKGLLGVIPWWVYVAAGLVALALVWRWWRD
jgi:hypothetical protein